MLLLAFHLSQEIHAEIDIKPMLDLEDIVLDLE